MTQNPLSDARANEIAHAIAEKTVADEFRITSRDEFERRIGQAAKSLGIGKNELRMFVESKLPKILGEMLG